MNTPKINYDEEADVLYVSFGRSEHVTGVELTEHILLRLVTGKESGSAPRAVGLTFISLARMIAHEGNRPVSIPWSKLSKLPTDLRQAVLAVVTTPPVSDFLSVGLSLSLEVPSLPQRLKMAA